MMENKLLELPEKWDWGKLEDISEIILGQSPPSNTYNDKGSGLPFFQGKLEFGPIYPKAKKFCSAPKKIAEKNDILLSVRAPVGPTNICPEKACIGRGLAAIKAKKNMHYLYLFYFFRTNMAIKELDKKSTGTTFKAINGNVLKNLSIPLPPLTEQYRIVNKIEELFTKLDSGIEALQKIKTQLKLYRQAVLKYAFEGKLTEEWRGTNKDRLEPASVLLEKIKKEKKENAKGKFKELPQLDTSGLPELPDGWEWVRLHDFSVLISGQHILSGDYNNNRKGMPYLTGPVDFGPRNPVITKWTENPKVISKKGDVLITVKGAGVGKTNILDIEEATISRQIMAIRSLQSDHNYLFYYILSNHYLFQKLGAGSTVPGIDREAILNVKIPLLSLSEQQKIVQEIELHFSIADQVETIVDQNLKKAETLRQSILKKAFEGKLVPQNPSDEPAEKLLDRIKAEKQKEENSKKKNKRSKK